MPEVPINGNKPQHGPNPDESDTPDQATKRLLADYMERKRRAMKRDPVTGRLVKGTCGGWSRIPEFASQASQEMELREKMLEVMREQAEAVTHSLLAAARAGDMKGIDLYLSRVMPARKGSFVGVMLPDMETAADCVKAIKTVRDAMGAGKLTLEEAKVMSDMIESARRSIEQRDLERRVSDMEAAQKGDE